MFAEDEAALLIEAATTEADLDDLVARRVEGLPLEHLVGWAAFHGLRIAVGPGVFVPRRRTEFLVELAAELAPPEATVLDLCCGSGALGAALVARRPDVRVTASDIDPVAAGYARRNLPPTSLVVVGDLFDRLPVTLRGRVDMVLANTPYVPSAAIALMPREARLHEPRATLDGGVDGLDLQRRVAAEVPSWLAPGGRVLVEVSETQATAAAALLSASGLRGEVHEAADEVTVVSGTRVAPTVGSMHVEDRRLLLGAQVDRPPHGLVDEVQQLDQLVRPHPVVGRA